MTTNESLGDWNGNYTSDNININASNAAWTSQTITLPNASQTGITYIPTTIQPGQITTIGGGITSWPNQWISTGQQYSGWQETKLPNILLLTYALPKGTKFEDLELKIEGNLLTLLNKGTCVAVYAIPNGHDLENISAKFEHESVFVLVPQYTDVKKVIEIAR